MELLIGLLAAAIILMAAIPISIGMLIKKLKGGSDEDELLGPQPKKFVSILGAGGFCLLVLWGLGWGMTHYIFNDAQWAVNIILFPAKTTAIMGIPVVVIWAIPDLLNRDQWEGPGVRAAFFVAFHLSWLATMAIGGFFVVTGLLVTIFPSLVVNVEFFQNLYT